MIQVEKEPKAVYDSLKCYERCVFCKLETIYWHKESNTPVCRTCAQNHSISEITKLKK